MRHMKTGRLTQCFPQFRFFPQNDSLIKSTKSGECGKAEYIYISNNRDNNNKYVYRAL